MEARRCEDYIEVQSNDYLSATAFSKRSQIHGSAEQPFHRANARGTVRRQIYIYLDGVRAIGRAYEAAPRYEEVRAKFGTILCSTGHPRT